MIPAASLIANAVEDALSIRIKTMPVIAEKVALAGIQVEYDAVKGNTMGFCYAKKPEDYPFHINGQ